MRRPQCGQRSMMPVSAARMRRRTSGRDGCGDGPVPEGTVTIFFSRAEAEILQEDESEHAHQGVMVQAAPRAALKMIEPQLLFDLLVRRLTHPAPLERCGQACKWRIGRVIGQMVFALAGRPGFADQPRLRAGPVPPAGHLRAVGDAHPHRGKSGAPRPFRSPSPAQAAALRQAQERRAATPQTDRPRSGSRPRASGVSAGARLSWGRSRAGSPRPDRPFASASPPPPKAGRARSSPGGRRRPCRTRRRPERNQTWRPRRSRDRSRPSQYATSAGAPSLPARRQRGGSAIQARGETGASQRRPAPHRAPASATPGLGNWRVCRVGHSTGAARRLNAGPA
jgi:hypothetical protein